MSRPKKRMVRLVMNTRAAQDPLAILRAVEDVFRPAMLDIRVSDSKPVTQSIPDEPLETEVSRRVSAALDEKAQRIENQLASVATANALTPTDAKTIVAIRSGLWKFCKDLAWKLTVSLVADGVKLIGEHLKQWLFVGVVAWAVSRAEAPVTHPANADDSTAEIIIKAEPKYNVEVKDSLAPKVDP